MLDASEVFLDPDAAGSVLKRKRHIVPSAHHIQVLRGDSIPEPQHVRLPTAVVGVVVEHIVSVARVVLVPVAPVAALQIIVPGSADKDIVSASGIQFVVTQSALKNIIGLRSPQIVVPIAAANKIAILRQRQEGSFLNHFMPQQFCSFGGRIPPAGDRQKRYQLPQLLLRAPLRDLISLHTRDQLT